MTVVKTDVDHNIDEAEFKQVIALTASLCKYQGQEYLEKLKSLNSQYEIPRARFISESQLHAKQVEKC